MIRAGRILNPATAEVLHDRSILVVDGKIAAVQRTLEISAETRTIDLSEYTVLPGLVDTHTHLTAAIDAHWDLGSTWIMTQQRRPGFRAILGVRNAKDMLHSGFTTVRDLGNAGEYLDVDLVKAIGFGIVPGPTIIPAGRIIAPYGGQFWEQPATQELLRNPEYHFADSPHEIRRAIRENIYWGAKVIKIVVDGKPYQYSVDDLRLIVEEATSAGLKVAAHVQTQRGARAAIEAKVASIEHGWVLNDDDLALARKNNVALVSTDFTVEQLLINRFEESAARDRHAKRVERLARAHRAGVTLVFGTDIMSDSPSRSRGARAIDYITSFVEAGIPPADILRAMTTNATRLLGVDHERGAIHAGLYADLIAVSGNPLEEILSLREVRFVMREGRIHRNDVVSNGPRH